MDYKRELFTQCTPYLQWLRGRDTAKNNDSKDTGKQVGVFPFYSCTDSVRTVFKGADADREMSYLFVNEDGVLHDGACALIARAFRENEKALVVYADEDYYGTLEELYHIKEDTFGAEITAEHKNTIHGLFRGEPWFKPNFSPNTLESFFYIGNIFAVKGQAIEELVAEFGDDIPLCGLVRMISRRVTAQSGNTHGTDVFVHIPEVLYTNNQLSKKDKLDGWVQDAFEKNGLQRIGGRHAEIGRLSVIIPSKDNFEVLRRCIETFDLCAQNTDYELIVVDNGSTDENRMRIGAFLEKRGAKYLYEKAEFNFSRMCNIGAGEADGDFLLFLNDDITVCGEAQNGLWLQKMMRYAKMKHVGAVGMKLHYPDGGMIQHVGITNMKIGPAHKLCGIEDKGNLYHGHNLADCDMLAVTGACMMIARETFARIGGFDETLAVAYNDVELCFRLYQSGLYNVQVNSAFLIHHESLSRGEDTSVQKQARLLQEKQKLYEKHPWASPSAQTPDPFYSPNLVQWEKDAQYHVEYQYECEKLAELRLVSEKERFRLLMREGIRKKLERTNVHILKIYNKLTGADRHMLHIDRMEREEGIITVTGWHVWRKKDNATLVKKLWLFDSHRTIYEAQLFPQMRRDVEALFVNEEDRTKNTALSGICLKLDASSLAGGRYSIGVIVEEKGRKRLICAKEYLEV